MECKSQSLSPLSQCVQRSEAESWNSTDEERVEKRWFLYLRFVGAAALALLVATRYLWFPGDLFPRVPLIYPSARVSVGWVARDVLQCFAVVGMACTAALFLFASKSSLRGQTRRFGYLWGLGFGTAVLVNQHAIQPWAYQFVAIFGLAATTSSRYAVFWSRCLVIGIYMWSAVGKFDAQFVETVGSKMVGQFFSIVGLGNDFIEPGAKARVAFLLPIGEFLCALLLLRRSTRAFGVMGAILMHAGLLFILGPMGLGHKPGVLIWNGLFIVQAVVLFWPGSDLLSPYRSQILLCRLVGPRRLSPGAILVVFMLVVPAGERFGWMDHWPSWALYAPHSSRATMWVPAHRFERLPRAIQDLMRDSQSIQSSDWLRVPLDQWSLESIGVPIYPQSRFQLGVAIAVAEAAGLDREVRVELRGQANRITGERQTVWLQGLPELRKATNRYRLNSLPWRFSPWEIRESRESQASEG